MTVLQHRASIGGKPIYDAPRGDRQSNWFECSDGSMPGVGRVLVRASDWEALTDDGSLTLKLWQRDSTEQWPSDPTLELPVRVHAAMPFLQGLVSSSDDGAFVELHLMDSRFGRAHASTIRQAFNVQKAGLPYDGSDPVHYPATTNAGVEWTWADLAAAVGVSASGYSFPSVRPRNVVFDGCSLAEASDRVASILHARLAFDWASGTLALMGTGESTAANDALWAEMSNGPALCATARFNDRRYPASLRFQFRVANAGADPYAADSRWYSKTLPTGYGPAGTVRAVDVGYWFGRDAGGSVSNSAELDAVAAFLLAANVLDRVDPVGDAKRAGIWPFKPDGKFRRVLWTFDAHELSTTVRMNADMPIRAEARRKSVEHEPVGDAFSARTIDGRVQMGGPEASEEFDAIITGHQSAGTNRWRYAWCSAVLEGDVYVRQSPPDLSGTTAQDYAVNGNETGNSATYKAYGLRLDGPDFPSGMEVVPIGSDFEGNLYDVHVRMRRTVDSEGNARYAFNGPNEVDGPCE